MGRGGGIWAGFQLRGEGGRQSPLARAPSPKKKEDSIDAPPEILRRLTAGARRWPGPKIQQKKNENGIFGISASRGSIYVFGGRKIDHFDGRKKLPAPDLIITDERFGQLSPFPSPPPPPVENPPPPYSRAPGSTPNQDGRLRPGYVLVLLLTSKIAPVKKGPIFGDAYVSH